MAGSESSIKLAKETDFQDYLIEIKKIVQNHMVKIQDFIIGDTVVAVKVPNTDKDYFLVNAMDYGGAKVFYLYKSAEM